MASLARMSVCSRICSRFRSNRLACSAPGAGCAKATDASDNPTTVIARMRRLVISFPMRWRIVQARPERQHAQGRRRGLQASGKLVTVRKSEPEVIGHACDAEVDQAAPEAPYRVPARPQPE